MRLPLRGALVAAVSSRLRRGISTAPASRPQLAIVDGVRPVNSASLRATLQLAEPPRFSELLVPGHHVNPLPHIDSSPESEGIFGGFVCSTSGDGLLSLSAGVSGKPPTPAPRATPTPPIPAFRKHSTGISGMPLRRHVGLSAAVSGRLRRGFSTVASRPPWALIYPGVFLVRSASPRASFRLAEPPGVSPLLVPGHLVGHEPFPDADSDIVPMLSGVSSTTSGDGLLFVSFMDVRATAPIVGTHGERRVLGIDLDPDVMRFVCNPLSGQLLRLPDIDGTKKTSEVQNFGLLTRSAHGHGPPDKYVVAQISEDRGAEKRSFVMRRFLSRTGEWEKLVDLPSPKALLPPERPLLINCEIAFAGKLLWVDLSWGIVSADPFSDRPELRFVELPSSSVLPAPTKAETLAVLARNAYRRVGVSEGRLRFVELSTTIPFLVSSFVLDNDSNCWMLEHQMALGRLWAHGGQPSEEDIPRIGAVDPLNASIIHFTIGTQVLAIDMNRGEVLGWSPVDEGESTPWGGRFLPCVLPPWLGSSSIPRGPLNSRSSTLSDILVRADKDKKN